MTGKKLNTFKTRIFLVALASMTLSVASCNPSTPAGPKLDSIAVKEGSVATEFFVGDQFSVEGGTLIARYSNNKTEEVAMTLDMVQNVPNMASEHLNYTVNVLYEKKEANYVINVRNPSITDISVKAGTSLKTQYFVGDEFSVDGGALIVRYNNNKTEEVAMTLAMVKNAPDMSAEHLNYEVKVEYEGVQTSFTINVVNPSVDSISIKDGTTLKTSYFVGDEFTVEGGKLVVRYNNNKSEEIDMTLAMVQNAPDMSTAHANYEVIVQYEQKQARYTINVVEPSITGIAVKENTTLKVSYVTRETFSVDGGVIVVSYNNNTTAEVDMTLAMIKNAPDMSVPHEDYEVQVEYEGFTTSYIINVEQAVYHLVLNAENGLDNEEYKIMDSTITGQNNKLVVTKKAIGNVTVNHYLAKANDAGYAKLAPSGSIYNYSTAEGKSALKGIQTITVNFTGGDLYYQVSRDLEGKIFTDKVALTSGTASSVSDFAPNYFILTAGDQEVTIESIDVAYLDIARNFLNVKQLGKEYTGIANETTYKLSINGDQIVLETLDKEQNDSFTGSIAVIEGQVKVDLTGIGPVYFNVNESRAELTVDGSKGLGTIFAGLKLNEVFNVEDFESYSGTGTGWDVQGSGHSFSAMSGIKSNFHADWNNSSGTQSALNWKLMGSEDYVSLKEGWGRNTSKAGLFKVSNSAGLRYATYSALYNVPRTIGKGTTFSFWAHGAVALNDGTPSSANAKIKMRVFYKNPIQNVDDSNGKGVEFTIPAGSDWTEYTIQLDEGKEYYGYCIYSASASKYLPIDDIKVYTASPYAHYEAPTPPEPEHHYKAFTGKGDVQFISQVQSVLGESAYFILGTSADGYAKGYVLAQAFVATSYDVDETTRTLTLECSLSYSAAGQNITITGITGVFNEDYTVLNNVTLAGTVTNYISNNGAFALRADALSETQDFTGVTKDIANAYFKRQYMSDKWTDKNDYTDGINAIDVSTQGYNDNVSLQVRGYTKYSVVFNANFDPARKYHGLGYWVKNTSASKNLLAKFFSYTTTNLTSGVNMWGQNVVINAGDGWTLVISDFVDKSAEVDGLRNIRFYFEMSGGAKEDLALIDHMFFY